MNWYTIPSIPSYEINTHREVRSIRSRKPIQQKNGIVKLYNRSRHTYTSRSIESLYGEATGRPKPSSLSSSLDEQDVSGLLGSILDRYRNIPVESLSHKECIDLLKVLMPSRKKTIRPVEEKRTGPVYITEKELNDFYEEIKDIDWSGNTQEDVERIFAEYAS